MSAVAINNFQEEIRKSFELQTRNKQTISLTTAIERIKKLKSILAYLNDSKNEQRLFDALKTDLNKSREECLLSEIGVIKMSIGEISRQLKSWMRNENVKTPLFLMGADSYIYNEAKGVCLIISPWNYPFQLAINPLLFCIAAGCTAIMKPSEYSAATSAFLKQMVEDLFPPEEVSLFEGDAEVSKALLDLPFDHMYFTGSPNVGKIVMQAAAKHLSSITLELGGKSPVVIDGTANITDAAKKIAWGKLLNNSQTCIAPDYLLVHKSKVNEFTKALKSAIKAQYGEDIKSCPYYGRIISDRHFLRASGLIEDAIEKGAVIELGGQTDAKDRFFEPTILSNIKQDMMIMKEELFCPILPIIAYDDLDEAITLIKTKPKPLAMYIFSGKKSNINHLLSHTSAGGTVINDCMLHYANGSLPFGGVNNSGVGKSHGIHGFKAFTNERAVMHQKFGASWLLHPPFKSYTEKLLRFMIKWLG